MSERKSLFLYRLVFGRRRKEKTVQLKARCGKQRGSGLGKKGLERKPDGNVCYQFFRGVVLTVYSIKVGQENETTQKR